MDTYVFTLILKPIIAATLLLQFLFLGVSVIWFIASQGELHWQRWFTEHLGRNSIEIFKKSFGTREKNSVTLSVNHLHICTHCCVVFVGNSI